MNYCNIYQACKPTFNPVVLKEKTDYNFVAEMPIHESVKIDDDSIEGVIDLLERAFYLTNSIDCHWSQNKGLTVYMPKSRSTSIGDVVELNDNYYMVDIVGFRKMDKKESENVIVELPVSEYH